MYICIYVHIQLLATSMFERGLVSQILALGKSEAAVF